jgi:hypothetical protein
MRRLTGLLTSLLLFHLTLVGADLTCAKHGVQGAAHVSQADVSPHADHHAPPRHDAPSHDDTSCQVPTLPACCQALASCGVSIAVERSTESGELSHLLAGVLAAADDTPTSWTLEPDPPPPKA